MGVRKPSVQREDRHLDGKGQEEEEESKGRKVQPQEFLSGPEAPQHPPVQQIKVARHLGEERLNAPLDHDARRHGMALPGRVLDKKWQIPDFGRAVVRHRKAGKGCRGRNRDFDALGGHLEIKGEHHHQERDAAGHGVEEELERGVAALLAAPQRDQEEHGNEHQLPEDVEEHHVERHENAVHTGKEQKQEAEVAAHLALDAKACQHRHCAHDPREEEQRGREAIHPQMPRNAKRGR